MSLWLHLPAHGRGRGLAPELRRLLRQRPGSWDLPELPEVGGPLLDHGWVNKAQQSAAAMLGAGRCWFGVNGASGLLQAALLALHPQAFQLIQWAGAAYLLWLGIQAWRHAGTGQLPSESTHRKSLRSLFLQGLVANAINPKVVLFFLSFLPQFVVESQGQVEWQLGWLGLLFSLQAAILFGLLGYFSGAIGLWLNRRPTAGRWLDRVAGLIFVALGTRMIISR